LSFKYFSIIKHFFWKNFACYFYLEKELNFHCTFGTDAKYAEKMSKNSKNDFSAIYPGHICGIYGNKKFKKKTLSIG
jgi:hypothetical protein